MKTKTPRHLLRYPWYAPHLAYLAGEPGGARADLTCSDLTGANLRLADLTDAILDERPIGWPDPDPDLPYRVAVAATKSGDALEMSRWHTCQTTHCLAGWAIHLSGPAGYALEAATSPSVAGAMLMPPVCRLFGATNDVALAWCRRTIETALTRRGVGR